MPMRYKAKRQDTIEISAQRPKYITTPTHHRDQHADVHNSTNHPGNAWL